MKNFTCKECEDDINQKGCHVKHQYSCMQFLGIAKIRVINIEIEKGLSLKYQCKLLKKFYLQVIQGESKSKRIPCQTSILKHTILWSLMSFMWEMHELISVTVSYQCKLLKKIILARNVRMK